MTDQRITQYIVDGELMPEDAFKRHLAADGPAEIVNELQPWSVERVEAYRRQLKLELLPRCEVGHV